MSIHSCFPAAIAVAIAASTVQAGLEARSVTITNDALEPLGSVIFHVALPEGLSEADPWRAIRFVDELTLHSSTIPAGIALLNTAEGIMLSFEFEAARPVAQGGSVDFTLTLDNPHDVPFAIGWRTFAIPAPGALAIAIPGALLAVRRRRA